MQRSPRDYQLRRRFWTRWRSWERAYRPEALLPATAPCHDCRLFFAWSFSEFFDWQSAYLLPKDRLTDTDRLCRQCRYSVSYRKGGKWLYSPERSRNSDFSGHTNGSVWRCLVQQVHCCQFAATFIRKGSEFRSGLRPDAPRIGGDTFRGGRA